MHLSNHSRSVFVLLGLLAIYAISVPGNRSEAEDAFWYADVARTPMMQWDAAVYPQHPLYFPLIRGIHAAFEPYVPEARSYPNLVLVHAILGAVTVLLFHRLLRELGVSADAAVIGASMLAFSYGFWRYALEVEIPVWTCFASVLLVLAALRSRRTPETLALGVLGAGTALLHVLALAVAGFCVPLRLARESWSRASFYLVGFTATLGGAGVLIFSAVSGTTSLGDFAPQGGLGPGTLVRAVVGFGQSLVSANFLWGSPRFADTVSALFGSRMLQEERLMGALAPPWLFPLSVATCSLLAGITFLVIVERVRAHNRPGLGRDDLPFVAWFGAHALVLLGWEESNPELWIPAAVPFWILVTRGVIQPLCEDRRRFLVAGLAAAFLLHNGVGGMAWIRERAHDYNWIRSAWLMEHARDADLIVSADNFVLSRYLDYWTAGTVVNVADFSAEELGAMLETMRSWEGNVYVLDNVLSPPPSLCARDVQFCERLRPFAAALATRIRPVATTPVGTVFEASRSPR